MRVLFYQLSRDRAETLLVKLVPRIFEAGERLLVVSADEDQRRLLGEALWSAGGETFHANGQLGEPHADRQLILIADAVEPANGAAALALVDGQWREPGAEMTRVLFFFDEDTAEGARQVWRDLRGREGVDKEFWRQDAGKWIKAG